ncbi:MAG: serine/threonine-protein kinase [Paludibaculum sp.]
MATQLSIESLLFTARGAFPKVPGYRMLALLGRGGMGVVYAAVRAGTDKLVAIKLLRTDVATPANLARFDRERRILEQLCHPDIATLLDSGVTPDGTPYLAIDYIEGRSIVDYCQAQSPDLRSRVRLFYEVCLVVAEAHGRGIIHSDLKPSNILVDLDGHPKLLDFGIAKLMAAGEERVTVTGCRPLTPEYASIEQLRGGPITPASDVYSLGAILSELAGGADAVLDSVIRHAMAEQPEGRYQTARELGEDLAAYLAGRPLSIAAKPPRWRRQAIPFALALILIPALLPRSRVPTPFRMNRSATIWWRATCGTSSPHRNCTRRSCGFASRSRKIRNRRWRMRAWRMPSTFKARSMAATSRAYSAKPRWKPGGPSNWTTACRWRTPCSEACSSRRTSSGLTPRRSSSRR